MSFSSSQTSIKKILVIKLCCIGDILFMTPALRALKTAFPQAQIEFLATSWVSELVSVLPDVDGVTLWDEPYQKGVFKKFLSLFRIIKSLRRKNFDLAFIGHRSSAFAGLAWLSGIAVRAGFGNSFFLTHRAVFDGAIHETKRYLEIAKSLGARHDDFEMAIDLAHPPNTENKKIVALVPGGGVNPGTSMKIKRWGAQKYAELIARLSKYDDIEMILLGNQDDRNETMTIVGRNQNLNALLDLTGKTNFKELVSALKRCHLVVGGDTGACYLAAACGAPTLILYGPSDPRLVAPLGPKHRYLWGQPSCSPCYNPSSVYDKSRWRGREFICWKGTHECLDELSVDEVEKAALEILYAKSSSC